MTLSIEGMAVFCKEKGFVFPNSEIYGGLAGFWDYGPLGSELKKNIKDSWWKFHVQDRDDMVGIDGSIVSHKKIWEASGHVANFNDVYVKCKDCKKPNKLDKNEVGKVKCDCGGEYEVLGDLNLMFKTQVGPVEGNTAFLRPETAQLIFTNFKNVFDTSRIKLPFGIAQIGRAFRNEISPRDFLFRCREFEQMEIEYFIHPDDANNCPFVDDVLDHRITVYSAEMQDKDIDDGTEMTIKEALDKDIIKTQWHAYWLALEHRWFSSLGADPKNFRIRQHVSDEKSHYALDTWDLEYRFPFGWKELQGMANRTDFDLQQHIKHSKKDLSIFIEETKKKVVPHVVAEPSQGVDRAFLVFMFDAYDDDKERGNIVLHLDPKLAPVKVAVFPLVNKLMDKADNIYKDIKSDLVCRFDKAGSVGRRYARADEIGIPYCITVDFEEDGCVTIRDRETTEQKRVKIGSLKETLRKLLRKDIEFKDL